MYHIADTHGIALHRTITFSRSRQTFDWKIGEYWTMKVARAVVQSVPKCAAGAVMARQLAAQDKRRDAKRDHILKAQTAD